MELELSEGELSEQELPEPVWLGRTRACYDAVVDTYVERYGRGPVPEGSLEFAALQAFPAYVHAAAGPVLDVGAGPGRWTRFLADQGLDASGLDLSPGMVEHARTEHPDLRFEVGSMTSLPWPDRSLAGVLAWYSTIHVPDDALGLVVAEFARVLRPGGVVLLGFHVGTEHLFREDAYGHGLPLDVFLRTPEFWAGLLESVGLTIHARTLRGPEGNEICPQATLTARKTAEGT